MACSKPTQGARKKYVPGQDAQGEDIFNFCFLTDEKSKKFIRSHRRIMFIIRGPPGTGKNTLSSIICFHYPSSVICSADNYFNEAFTSKVRTKESLKVSHHFCQKRVKEECEKGTHPLIVQNSHMKKWETQVYVDFAAKYGYTIIMAITTRKFHITPAILEQSNRQGLNKKYFENRLRQWEENIPIYLGWFLSPDDCSFLLNQAKIAISALIGDGKFCNAFNAFSEKDILQYYKSKSRLFCISACCGSAANGREFYLSDTVQDSYGKSSELLIQGFLISKTSLLAVAVLPPDSKDLLLKPKQKFQHDDEFDSLASAFKKVEIKDPEDGSHASTFEKVSDSKGQTVEESEWGSEEKMSINNSSIIILGQAKDYLNPFIDPSQYVNDSFSKLMNSEGKIAVSEFLEFDDGTQYLRLPNNHWFVKSSKKILVSAVFTGLYE